MLKKLLTAVFLMNSCLLLAGGFQLTLQGIKQQGMGHTGTGLCSGAASLFFNPGSSVFLKNKLNTSAALNLIKGRAVFYDPISDYSAKTVQGIQNPISFYGSARISRQFVAGLAVYNPFGTTVQWEDGWKGRYLIQEVGLRTFYFQPTLSWRISEKVGLGGGLVYGISRLHFIRDIPVTNAAGLSSFAMLHAKASALGFNGGLFLRPFKRFSAGISYRSGLRFEFRDGSAEFNVPSQIRDRFPHGNQFSMDLPTPSVWNVGFSWDATSKLVLAADLNFTKWAVYRELEIDFERNTESLEDITELRNYKNTVTYRLGAQYTHSCCLALRAGLVYDRTPVPADYYRPETPDSDRFIFSTGLTYDINDHFAFDASYTFVDGRQVQGNYSPENFRGDYKFRAHILALGVTASF